MEHRLRGKGGPTASWGPWVPTPGCLRQRGSRTTTRAGLPQEWRQRGAWVPDPGCLAQRAHRAEPMLTSSGVLGSPLWLFVPLLASRNAAHRKASASILKTPTVPRKGIVDRARGVSSAQHPQILGRQRATCTAQVVCTSDWWAALTLQAAQAQRERQQCRMGWPPSSNCHTPAGTCS